MGRPLLSVCCFNVCLRSASLIIGFIFLLGCFYSTVHNAAIAARATNPSNKLEQRKLYEVQKSYVTVLVSFAVISGLSSYSSLLLIIGGYKDLPSYMLAWVWICVVYVACMFAYLILIAIMCNQDNDHVLSAVFAILAFAIPAVSAYFILVVYSYCQTFKQEVPERLEELSLEGTDNESMRNQAVDAIET